MSGTNKKTDIFNRFNPITGFLWTVSVISLCFILDNLAAVMILFLSNFAIAYTADKLKQTFSFTKKMFFVLLFFVFFQIIFTAEGKKLFYLIPYLNYMPVTDRGLFLGFYMALRTLTTITPIAIFFMTVPISRIVKVMNGYLKVPSKYTLLFISAVRFIPTLTSEMEQIKQAQASRGYHSDSKNILVKLYVVMKLSIPLLVSSIRKTEKMAIAIETRGYGSGEVSSFMPLKFGLNDIITCVIFVLFIIAAIILRYFY